MTWSGESLLVTGQTTALRKDPAAPMRSLDCHPGVLAQFSPDAERIAVVLVRWSACVRSRGDRKIEVVEI